MMNKLSQDDEDDHLKLLKLTAHLQSLITSLEDIVFELDGNHIFKNVWVSDERMLFMPKEAFLGKTIAEVMGPQSAIFIDPVNQAIEKGTVQEVIYKHINPDVNEWFRARIKPVAKAAQPENYILVLSIQDITSQKLADIALAEAKKELENSNRALIEARNHAEKASKTKSDFLSVMSHEIRTPLNGIIGIANLLKLNHTMDQKEYIGNLIFSADHLMQLINDILDLTKMENEKLELVLAEIDLFRLVKNISNQFKSLAGAKGIQLKCYLDDDIPRRLIADPIRLSQMLNNLISNAIKFTDEGEVTLLIKLLSVHSNKALIHFSVKDTGMGIPSELQDSVFESFKQVQQAVRHGYSGTGLGLTITQKLAELHNSRVVLSSEAGIGSEFHFDLSFEIAEDQDIDDSNAVPSVFSLFKDQLKGLKVLLVEDNLINVMVAQKQLEYFGVDTTCAENGNDALELIEKNHYHVALLDLHMPVLDGYALAGIIRNKYPEVHPVVFTADIMAEVKLKFARIDVYDILNKPFAPEKMFEVLLKVAKARSII
uniref:ATP-binding protein n=1 Tax=Pedobacter schmidteae TaxID=2201271 RepID=UPI000EB0A5ED|nr:ATP-binding protein [Pedobacter schmidteae]